MNTLHLEILTPDRQVLDLPVESVTLQGSTGRLGILPDHTPLISKLAFGILEYVSKGQTQKVLCGEGLVEVLQNKVTVIVRSAETGDAVDIERAKRAKERAKSILNSKDDDMDMARAEKAFNRASSRLEFSNN